MTKKIALHCMKSASELERELCEECPIYGQTGCDHCYEDALQYVIAMLDQEPFIIINKPCVSRGVCEHDKQRILDKIRAEIEHVIDYTYDSTDYDKALYNGAYKDGLYEALDIIDKYKAERSTDV